MVNLYLELESPEGVTYEPVIHEHICVPKLPMDWTPATEGLVTCDPVTPETGDLVL